MGITGLNTNIFVFRPVLKIFFMKKNSLFSWVLFLFILINGWFFTDLIKVNALTNDPLTGLNQSVNKVDAYKDQSIDDNFVQNKTGQVINIVLSFIGVLFFILMIYAGILWMTARGNDQQIAKAKDLLINAIIGLIITLAAYAITSFIGTSILS